jgi:hypothetical protein
MLNESYRFVGDMLFKLGDYEKPPEHYRKELALTRDMVASDPSNAHFAQRSSRAD